MSPTARVRRDRTPFSDKGVLVLIPSTLLATLSPSSILTETSRVGGWAEDPRGFGLLLLSVALSRFGATRGEGAAEPSSASSVAAFRLGAVAERPLDEAEASRRDVICNEACEERSSDA